MHIILPSKAWFDRSHSLNQSTTKAKINAVNWVIDSLIMGRRLDAATFGA